MAIRSFGEQERTQFLDALWTVDWVWSMGAPGDLLNWFATSGQTDYVRMRIIARAELARREALES